MHAPGFGEDGLGVSHRQEVRRGSGRHKWGVLGTDPAAVRGSQFHDHNDNNKRPAIDDMVTLIIVMMVIT